MQQVGKDNMGGWMNFFRQDFLCNGLRILFHFLGLLEFLIIGCCFLKFQLTTDFVRLKLSSIHIRSHDHDYHEEMDKIGHKYLRALV